MNGTEINYNLLKNTNVLNVVKNDIVIMSQLSHGIKK
jgi:hypothetical protein